MNAEIDIRPILPTIRVPTLVLHRTGDRVFSVEGGRYLAERIPDATFVELPGDDHLPWVGDADAVLGEIEHFLTGARPAARPGPRAGDDPVHRHRRLDRARCPASGTRMWKETLAAHDERAKIEIGRHQGTYVNTTGDGLFARFDGPARAVRCALAIGDALRPLGLEIRAGCPHGRGRACRRRRPRTWPCTSAPASPPWRGRAGVGVEHGEGPGRRLGPLVRRLRNPSLKGVEGEWHLYEAARETP